MENNKVVRTERELKNKVVYGDTLTVLKTLPSKCVDTIITSPPYWGLRSYLPNNHKDKKLEIGLEPTLDEFINKLLGITLELKRVLKKSGVMFWNHGDCYLSGNRGYGGIDPKYKNKNTQNIPANRIGQIEKCLALQNFRLILKMIDNQGWILRNSITWNKPNAMPSSVQDRFSNKYEPVFMLVKNKRYYFDLNAVRVPHQPQSIERAKGIYTGNYTKEKMTAIAPKTEYGNPDRFCHPAGKNPGDIWTIATQPFSEAHFATFPEKLITPMIKSSCPKDVCVKCGKARERIIDAPFKGATKHGGKRENTGIDGNLDPKACFYEGKTIGWTKCDCSPQEYEPGICLDPFFGSGTVGVVAKKLGRNYLGIDLNEDYIKMAERRISRTNYQPEFEL